MGKYETKNSSSVVRSFGAASAEMFQPEVNASSYQIRRRYFRLQKFIRLCIEMRYLVIFISMNVNQHSLVHIHQKEHSLYNCFLNVSFQFVLLLTISTLF